MNALILGALVLVIVANVTSETCTTTPELCQHVQCTGSSALACVDSLCTCFEDTFVCANATACHDHFGDHGCPHSIWVCYSDHTCHCFHFNIGK